MALLNKAAAAGSSGRAHVYHIDEDHSPAHAGMTEIVSQTSRYLASQDWPTTIVTAGPGSMPVADGVELVKFPLSTWGKRWRYPQGMKAYLDQVMRIPGSVFHIHGTWGAPQLLTAQAAKRHRAPALLTAHGLLEPWNWHFGIMRWLRYNVYWRTLGYPAFRHLAVIHCNTIPERDNLAQLFPGQRLEIIPNAIDLTKVDNCLASRESEPGPSAKEPYILYLGQLHPKKGIDILIEAFAQAVKGRDFRLLIVGPSPFPDYTEQLQALVARLNLSSRVSFPGPVYASQKWQVYRDAWAFCLPSRSEGMSMVCLEAAAAATPVITTYEANIEEWRDSGAIIIHPRVEELASVLDQVLSWSEAERHQRGGQLRHLVERCFSWEAVGPQWLSLYLELAENYG
ncbi:MAG: glycosyltransferase [Desulfobacteraceae bacterium]